jgi:DNA-directed RNA polymerase subunit E"
MLTEKDTCPVCSTPTSKRWRGVIVIIDPTKSIIAKKINISKPGKYALKVQ